MAELEVFDTADAIVRMLGEGAEDDEILRRIDPDHPERMRPAIQHLRSRLEDGLGLPANLRR